MKPVNKTVCSLAALAPLAMAQSANAGQRPNIIFFLVDDFGWTETSLPFGEETQYGTTGPHGRHDDQRLRLSRIDPDTNQHDDGHERRAHGHHVVLLLI